MKTVELIQKNVDELETIAQKIEDDYCSLLEKLTPEKKGSVGFSYCIWKGLDKDTKESQRTILRNYQNYYTKASNLINQYLPERSEEFNSQYSTQSQNGVKDYLELKKGQIDLDKILFIFDFIDVFEIQRGILLSIPDIIEIKALNIKNIISSEFIQSELDEAEILCKSEFYRAAGALAGVALERHLIFLCEKYEIEFSLKENISALNDKLRNNEIFDTAKWRKIQHLGDIRNKCDHPGEEEPTKSEIHQLMDGMKMLLTSPITLR